MSFPPAMKSPWPLSLLFAWCICPFAFASAGGKSSLDETFGDFLGWVEAYVERDASASSRTIVDGEKLAEDRRPRLVKLIEEAPKKAAEVVISPGQREKLPPSVRKFVERPVELTGRLQAVVADDFKRGTARYDYYFAADGRTYRAFLALEEQASFNRPLRIEGFLLGGRVLVTCARPAP